MWMEETIGSRINVNRAEEAIATGADQIAVGCPFCRVMLSDGLTLKQSEGAAREEVEIIDIAQMLLAGVKRAPEPTPVEDEAVVAEAEAATAAAATTTDTDAESIDKPEEVGAGARASTDGDPGDKDTSDVEALDEPSAKSAETDQDIAAESNVKVDESGGGHADESAGPEEPRNADARAVAPSSTVDASGDSDNAADEAVVNAAPAGEKEEAAWANVGPVNTDLTPSGDSTPEPEPEPTPEPAAEAEPEAAAEPEADLQPTLDFGSEAEPEQAEDIVELSDANPSGEELTEAATQAVPDVDTHGQATDGDAVEEWVEEGGTQKPSDDETNG